MAPIMGLVDPNDLIQLPELNPWKGVFELCGYCCIINIVDGSGLDQQFTRTLVAKGAKVDSRKGKRTHFFEQIQMNRCTWTISELMGRFCHHWNECLQSFMKVTVRDLPLESSTAALQFNIRSENMYIYILIYNTYIHIYIRPRVDRLWNSSVTKRYCEFYLT